MFITETMHDIQVMYSVFTLFATLLLLHNLTMLIFVLFNSVSGISHI